MRPVPYQITPERLTLAGLDPTRGNVRRACASSEAHFAWLKMDVCAAWRSAPNLKTQRIASSEDVVAILREFLAMDMNLRELFGVLCLNARHVPIGFAIVSQGGVASTQVDMRMLYKPVLLSTAMSMIVVHNHPSGDPKPSAEDIAMTKRILEISKIIGIPCLDHIILAGSDHFSFLDAGLMTTR